MKADDLAAGIAATLIVFAWTAWLAVLPSIGLLWLFGFLH